MKRLSIIAVLACLIGCGTFSHVVQSSPSGDTESPRFVELVPLEGRSSALVLEIRTTSPAAAGDRLEIYRAVDGAEYAMLQLVELDDRLSTAISEGIQFVDEEIPEGSVSYVAVLIGSDESARESRPLDIVWADAPPKPELVRAAAVTAHAVELSWDEFSAAAVIFRRDVLDPEARPLRIIELQKNPSRFVDGNLQEGGVYAYRVAFAHERDGFLHFGAPTEEVYVTLPGEAQR